MLNAQYLVAIKESFTNMKIQELTISFNKYSACTFKDIYESFDFVLDRHF